MKYIVEKFESMAAMVAELNERKLLDGWGQEYSHDRGGGWTGTAETYADADALALNGDKASAEKVRKSSSVIRNATGTSVAYVATSRVRRSVAGSRPCVPAAIVGHPEAMYRREVQRVARPVVNVFYHVSASASVSADDIAAAGARVMEALMAIERVGVRVSLYVGNLSYAGNQTSCVFAKVKDSDRDMDVLRMAYAMVNPSFFRRHVFRWFETREGLSVSNWRGSYGHPVHNCGDTGMKAIREAMQKNGFAVDCLFGYYDICNKTAEEIAKKVLHR